MVPNSQPQSRWTAFVERWDGRLERFRQAFDPFSAAPSRKMRTWAVVALAIGLVVLAGLITFGVMWIINHHKWGLVYALLKVMKLFGLGALIVTGLLFRDRLKGMPLFARIQGSGAARPKE
jgi:hypothetical protein